MAAFKSPESLSVGSVSPSFILFLTLSLPGSFFGLLPIMNPCNSLPESDTDPADPFFSRSPLCLIALLVTLSVPLAGPFGRPALRLSRRLPSSSVSLPTELPWSSTRRVTLRPVAVCLVSCLEPCSTSPTRGVSLRGFL